MIQSSHRYVASAVSEQGKQLGNLPLSPDFGQAAECAYLTGVRRGLLPARMRHTDAQVTPVWDSEKHEPHVAGLRFDFGSAGGAKFSFEISSGYLQSDVADASSALVNSGALAPGELLHYSICAFPGNGDDSISTRAEQFTVESTPPPLVLVDGSLADFENARMATVDPRQGGEIPVFIDHRVIEEAKILARHAGSVEVGGVLIGHLVGDPARPEVFVHISAQIPATHTVAGAAHLTFTAETWAAARSAITLRDRGEIYTGWWHFHPHFCARCPAERRRQCVMAKPFFSPEDRCLHKTVFGRAFDVALLLSDLGEHISADLFGWQAGRIEARGYATIDSGHIRDRTLTEQEIV